MNVYYNEIYGSLNNVSDIILSKVGKDTLMSKEDHMFLSGIIEKFKPKRILEVGVYWGGTTVVILDLLQKYGLKNTEVISVDIMEMIGNKPVGWLVDECKNEISNYDKHTLIKKCCVADVIEELSKETKFDLVIIDTAHFMPGEVLDFLACLPFVEDEGIIVLHDVMLNNVDSSKGYVTKLVFDAAKGEKYWNLSSCKIPNIAAVKINPETRVCINDIISLLSICWQYNPGKDLLDRYRVIIKNYYLEEQLELYDRLVGMSTKVYEYNKDIEKELLHNLLCAMVYSGHKKYIYGAGVYGKLFYDTFKEHGLEKYIDGFIISDGQKKQEFFMNKKVMYLSECELTNQDIIFNSLNIDEVEQQLAKLPATSISLKGIVQEKLLFSKLMFFLN